MQRKGSTNSRSRIKRSIIKRKPIQVTERDLHILKTIDLYRVLSTDQIYRLYFPSVNRTRKRLYQLWQNGYLNRIIRPTRLGDGSSSFLYALTRRGISLIHQAGVGQTYSTTTVRKGLSPLFAEHTLRINDFHICIELISRKYKQVRPLFWQQGRRLKMPVTIMNGSGVRVIPVIPDAFFFLRLKSRDYSYFLEIDLGTTSLSRIQTKCRAYINLWKDRQAVRKLEIRSFRVLYITTSPKRSANLLNSLKVLSAQIPRLNIIYVTDFTKYSLASPQKLFEAIWQLIENRSIVDSVNPFQVSSFQNSRQCQVNHQYAVQNPMSTNGVLGPGG